MPDIIDFVIENAKEIKSYEVDYYSHTIEVTFTMNNGDTFTFFDSE